MEHLTFQWLFTISCLCITQTDGHGTMVMPHNWFDHQMWLKTAKGLVYDYIGMKSKYQCLAGYDLDNNKICPRLKGGCKIPSAGCSCLWYKNFTFITNPTIYEKKYLTYNYVEDPEDLMYHPWRAPGVAYVDSPCGVAGGNMYGCSFGDCKHDNGGYGYGVDSLGFDFPHNFYVTKWRRGDIVEAAWAISANHGGGYSYRLCKLPKEGRSALTEKICQQIPLKFFGNMQWAQYGEDISTRFSFPAIRISNGTFPPGSQWTKNPIPACRGSTGGSTNPTPECTLGYQFPPPRPGMGGFGYNKHIDHEFAFSVIDRLIIPKDIEPGQYVLSFRWDCEQSPQVWNTCSSIEIE